MYRAYYLLRIQPYFTTFVMCLMVLAAISVFARPHVIDGDAVTYVDAIKVLNGAPLDESIGMHTYVIHRIMTTFLGLEIINGLSFVFGSVEVAWLVWGTILYFFVNILFYRLLFRMFKSARTALIGGLFFAANYAMLIFGLTYFMDIGGWSFYIFSIYSLYRYIEAHNSRDLWVSVLAMSVGGFFKENALVAYVPLFFVMFSEYRTSLVVFLRKIIPLSLVAGLPFIIHQVVVYLAYGEHYLHWVSINKTAYIYYSRIIEYIKSFGSLLNFLAPVSLVGLWVAGREYVSVRKIDQRFVFIAGVLVSSIPAVMWPGITQRVLFMVVPGLVMLACFAIKRYEKYWYAFIPVLIVYVLMSLYMDSFVLNFVNLPF
jgi:hypothetical protein